MYLSECRADSVVSFLEVLYTAVREARYIPAVSHHSEAQVKSTGQVKQIVRLRSRPRLRLQVLQVLSVRERWDGNLLQEKIPFTTLLILDATKQFQ